MHLLNKTLFLTIIGSSSTYAALAFSVPQTDTTPAINATGSNSVTIHDNVSSVSDSYQTGPQDRLINAPQVNYSLSVTGGTGDIIFDSTGGGGADDPNDNLFERINITDLAGVTSITFSITFSEFIASRDDGAFTGNGSLRTRPFGGSVGILNAGTGVANSDFLVEAQYNNIFSSTTPGGDIFQNGVPTDATFIGLGSAGFETTATSGNSATFTSTDGFDGTISGVTSNQNLLGFRGVNLDGADDFNASDAQSVYLNEVVYTISAAGGASEFSADTEFVFSIDGAQFENIATVPEPASTLLVALGAGFTLLRRKRS